jgi:hypothetical protein
MIFVALGAVLLVTTCLLAAAALRLESYVGCILAAYLLGWAEIVALTELLSLVQGVNAHDLLAGQAVVLTAVLVVWFRAGRPLPRVPRYPLSSLTRHPIVTALTIVVSLAVGYEAVVGLTTPSAYIDELWYHLPRAAAWLSHGGIYQIPGGNVGENAYPPNAEIGVLYGFALLHRDTFATIPQLAAEVSLVLVIFGIGRRLGASAAAALFAGLLALTMSEVALESMTALNDIVVASFIGTAVYFTLGRHDNAELAMAGIALGLALGTKYTAFFAVPILVLVALATLGRRQLAVLIASTVVGFAAFGAYGYTENIVHSNTPLGAHARAFGSTTSTITAPGVISTMARNAYRFIDLSGYRIKTRWLHPFESVGRDVFRLLHIPLAPPESSSGGSPMTFDFNVGSDPGGSWYGPLGALLVIPLSLVFGGLWVCRRTSRVRGLLALAFPLYLFTTALVYRYTSQGRFFITPIVLTLPLAATLYSRRRLAAAIAAVAAVSLLFALAYDAEKPTGLSGATPVWQLDRAGAQAIALGPDVARLIRAVNLLPAGENIGFEEGQQLYFGYALYGPRLQRRLVPVSSRHPLADADRLHLRVVYLDTSTATTDLHVRRGGWTLDRFAAAGELAVKAGT